MKTTKHKFSKGFTLVEIMIAAGMLGALSLAVMKITTMISSNQKKLAHDYQTNQLLFTITTTLANKKSCEKSLITDVGGTLSVAGGPIPTISAVVGAGSVIIATSGNIYGQNTQGRIQLDSMVLDNFSGTPGSGTPGSADLILTITRLGTVKLGAKTYTRQIKLSVVANASSQVIACRTESHAYNEAMCSAIGGNWNTTTNKCDNITIDTSGGGGVAITANGEINATADIITSTNLISTGGNVVAEVNITANTGNITASAGSITAEVNITANTGNITATAGSITANSDITSNTGNITASDGDIKAIDGNISAAGSGNMGDAGSGTIDGRYVFASEGMFVGQQPSSSPDPLQLATTGWVSTAIARDFLDGLAPAEKNAIYSDLLAGAQATGYDILHDNIIDDIFDGNQESCGGKFIKEFDLSSHQWEAVCEDIKTGVDTTDYNSPPSTTGSCRWVGGETTYGTTFITLIRHTITAAAGDSGSCRCGEGEVLAGIQIKNGYEKMRCYCCELSL